LPFILAHAERRYASLCLRSVLQRVVAEKKKEFALEAASTPLFS
jgi:hypothetical protein